MIFRKCKTIEKVYRYSFLGSELLCSFKQEDKSGLLIKMNLDTGVSSGEIQTMTAQDTFIPWINRLVTKDNRNFGLILDDSFEIVKEISDSLRVANNHSISNYISMYRGKLKNKEFGIYSLLEKKLLWMSSQQKALEVFGDKIIGQSEFEIYRTEADTGKLLWKSDLKTKYPELSGVRGGVRTLGLYENLIIAAIESIDKLIALDFEKGELKWERNSFPSLDRLDEEKGVIHSISSGYCKLDSITGEEVDTFIDQSYFKEAGIFSQRNNYAIDGDHLITTDYQKGVIGAFNTVTHKFDWLHEEEGVSFPAPSPVIYQAPYLLVHDHKGTLHIFEKE